MTLCGSQNPQWRGGRYHTQGYIKISAHGHPNADANGRVFEHILIAEKALGKHLPAGACVHHFDETTAHNVNSNLVICRDHGYHRFLHQRTRAFRACGHANWRKCRYCGIYDNPDNLFVPVWKGRAYHSRCHAEYQKTWRGGQK